MGSDQGAYRMSQRLVEWGGIVGRWKRLRSDNSGRRHHKHWADIETCEYDGGDDNAARKSLLPRTGIKGFLFIF
jgi:hypothetical protein